MFLERMESYVSSGLSVDRALHIIEEESEKREKTVIRRIRLSIESGHSLADSCALSVKLSPTILGIIRHGESSGRLAQSLGSARSLLEHSDELKKKITSAMIYPVAIGIFATLLTLGLVQGVMPQIIPMLESLHVSLPLLTRVVIAFSHGLVRYGLLAGVIFTVLIVSLPALYQKSVGVRFCIQKMTMRIPLIGSLLVRHTISVMLQSCGLLIETGSPAGSSYAKSVAALPLLPLKNMFELQISGLNRGAPINLAFKAKEIPGFISSLISAGEISGTLGASMVRAAAILDKDMDHMLKRLTSLIEPLMMICMGLVVGAIALSIMMPIYDISRILQK